MSPLASKKQTKNKVKDLTSKLGTRMETGRLRRDLLGLRVEDFNYNYNLQLQLNTKQQVTEYQKTAAQSHFVL